MKKESPKKPKLPTKRVPKSEMKSERTELVAPCGIDCGICEVYTCRDDPRLFDYLVSIGIPKERIPCKGCRPLEGKCPVIPGTCSTFSCAKGRKADFCFECREFPCEMLNPSADRADVLPHNTKVFNLCTIKRDGVEGFIAKSGEIKKRYYQGKMKIGSGPQV